MAIWQIGFNVINKKNTDEDICYWNNEPVGADDVTVGAAMNVIDAINKRHSYRGKYIAFCEIRSIS